MKDLLIQNDHRLNIVRFFIFFIINLIIIIYFCYPNLSIEQLYTEQYRMTERIDGIPYYKYENLMIDFIFKYPYTFWNFGNQTLINKLQQAGLHWPDIKVKYLSILIILLLKI